MDYAAVMLHRILQAVDWYGKKYVFLWQGINEYKENNGESEEAATIKGVFHNGTSRHLEFSISDAAITWNRNAPYILAAWDDAKSVHSDDFVIIGEKTFKVVRLSNVQKLDTVADISLEEVQQ